MSDIVRVEAAGWAGWVTVFYSDGTRASMTLRELDDLDPEGELQATPWGEVPENAAWHERMDELQRAHHGKGRG